jgi:hypothetical protein
LSNSGNPFSSRSFFAKKCEPENEMSIEKLAALLGMPVNKLAQVGVMLTQVFEFFDMDGSGSIDDYEFICSLTLFTMTPIEQRIATVYSLFDSDNSLALSYTEFEKLISILLSIHGHYGGNEELQKQKAADIKKKFFSNDSLLSLEIFKAAATQDEVLRECFINLSVFGPNEVNIEKFDNDLTEEFNKFILLDQRDPNYESRKKGIDEKTPAEMGAKKGNEESAATEEQSPEEKPWKVIAQKSARDYQFKGNESDTTNNLLELEYVYGFRCHDSRNNIFYNSQGKLIYHVAQVGIQLDTLENKMQFVTQNQDDILCISCHNEYTVTGDIGEQPVLSIWNNVTMKPVINVAAPFLKKGIYMVEFSHDGNFIAVNCMDVGNTIIVLDFSKLLNGEKESRLPVT